MKTDFGKQNMQNCSFAVSTGTEIWGTSNQLQVGWIRSRILRNFTTVPVLKFGEPVLKFESFGMK